MNAPLLPDDLDAAQLRSMSTTMIAPSLPPSLSRLNKNNYWQSSAPSASSSFPFRRSISYHPTSIKFNPEVRVRTVENIDDLSRDVREAVWYNSEDFKLIRRRERNLMRKLSLHRLQQQQAEQENCHSILPQCSNLIHKVLALETREERDARCQIIRDVQMIVLCEQSNRGEGRLARLYSRIANPSVMAARDRGLNVEIVLRNLELVEEHQQNSEIARPTSERRWSATCGSATAHASSACNNTSCARKRSMDWTSLPSSLSPTSVMRGPTISLDAMEAAVQVTHHQVNAAMTDVEPREPLHFASPPSESPVTLASAGLFMMEQ
jgi:hypothetical protein